MSFSITEGDMWESVARLVAFMADPVVASARRVHLAVGGVLRFTAFEGIGAQDAVDTFALMRVPC